MRPTVWHKLNDGDVIVKGHGMDADRYTINLKHTERKATADGYVVSTEADCIVNDSNIVSGTYTFTVHGDGSMVVSYAITPRLTCRYVPLVGMAVKAKPVRWFGLGPDEAWPNKKSVEMLGLWDARSFVGTRQTEWLETANGWRITPTERATSTATTGTATWCTFWGTCSDGRRKAGSTTRAISSPLAEPTKGSSQ